MSERRPIIIVECGEDFEHKQDLARIIQAFANAGYTCTMHQADQMWQYYSDTMAAGWMSLPEKDEDIIATVKSYFQVDIEALEDQC